MGNMKDKERLDKKFKRYHEINKKLDNADRKLLNSVKYELNDLTDQLLDQVRMSYMCEKPCHKTTYDLTMRLYDLVRETPIVEE
jgi:hypothetical protein